MEGICGGDRYAESGNGPRNQRSHGQIDLETARRLKESGVDQALVDIIGDDATAREVYHLAEGASAIRRTMESLTLAGLEIIPRMSCSASTMAGKGAKPRPWRCSGNFL